MIEQMIKETICEYDKHGKVVKEMVSLQDQAKEYLKQSGRKKKWLAEQLGITPSTLSEWLGGRSAFRQERVKKLIQILNNGK